MGIIQQTNTLFLNVSKGHFVNKKKDISCYAYNGHLREVLFEEDEFEGKPILKLKLKFQDDKGENAVISATAKSYYSLGFFQRIAKINPNQPITIGVSASEQNEKMSFCWVKQGDTIKVEDKSLYKPEKKTIEGNEIVLWDKSIAKFRELAELYNKKASQFIPEDGTNFLHNEKEELDSEWANTPE